MEWAGWHVGRVYQRLMQKIRAGQPVDQKYLRFLSPKSPLLARLKNDMPGTHLHSVRVGSMSASSALEIGANPDLTRAIAYHHDIGKTVEPELYFEAQTGGPARRIEIGCVEDLQTILSHPADSRRILINEGFPPEVCAAVLEHHGTIHTRVKILPEVERQLRPGQLHYPGPKPRSKESAIVMLADSCERALNTMSLQPDWPSEPTRELILGVIERVGRELRSEGQFTDSSFSEHDQKTITGKMMWWMFRFYNNLDTVRTPYQVRRQRSVRSRNNP